MSNFFVIRQTREEWEAEDTSWPANYIGVESDVVDGIETGSLKAKLFNGIDPWNELNYWNPSDASGGEAVWGAITGTLSTQTDLQTALNAKQVTLISGTNIKTVNSNSILGSGDIAISGAIWGSIAGVLGNQTDLQTALNAKQATLVSGSNIKTIDGGSILGSGDIAISSGALYVENYVSVQAALTAFQASSAKVLIFGTGATYTITAGLTVGAGLTDKIIEGNNARITLNGVSLTGLIISNSSRTTIRNLQFTGSSVSDNQSGMVITTSGHCFFEGCYFTNLAFGMATTANPGASAPNTMTANNFVANGLGLYLAGEYDNIIGNNFTQNTIAGVKIITGNARVIANSITTNTIGVLVDSTSGGNADHGILALNSINHNTTCGVHVKNLVYSMSIRDNEIWANFGGANLAHGATYGVFIENGTGVQLTCNTIARNLINIGVNGVTRSAVEANLFLSDSVIIGTQYHIKEYVGRQNNTWRIGANTIGDEALVGGGQPYDVFSAEFDDPPIFIDIGDETSSITTGTAKKTFRMPFGYKLVYVRSSVNVAPTGQSLIVDINKTGSTILSTKLSIDAGEQTSTTAINPVIISDHDLTNDSEITIDVDQVGSGTAGTGLKLWMYGYKYTGTLPTPGWSPASLTQAVTRYKATNIIGLADSDPVSLWQDSVGLNDAVGVTTARPLYKINAGDPYVSFDGTDDHLNTGIIDAFGDFAVFLVFRMFNMTEAASRIIDKRFDVGFWIGTDASGTGNLGGGIEQASGALGDFYTASANTWYAMLFQRSGTTKTIRFAGGSHTATVSNAALSNLYQITLGAESGSSASAGQVDFKEIVICNDDISGGDLTNLVSYALSEYGLTL